MIERITELSAPPSKHKMLRLMVHIRYSNGTERYQRVRLAEEFIAGLQDALVSNMEVRECRIYEELFMHHKSFADDFHESPESMLAALGRSTTPASVEQRSGP